MVSKPAILMMSYGRHEMTAKVLRHNLANTGIDCGLFVGDRKGIARNCNIMLYRAMQYDYDCFVVCGNDILEPDNWVKLRMDFINSMPNVGCVSIPLDKICPQPSAEMVIANIMISREVVEKVGAFDEAFDPYGAIDLDYNQRCTKAGYVNYYLPNLKADHIHYHDGKDLYGYIKQEEVDRTWSRHVRGFSEKEYNIPLLDMKQYFGE